MKEIPRTPEQLFDAGRSARQKYAELVVGRSGLAALLRHELILMASQATPGAVGLVLRRWLYPKLLGACGRNVVFGQNVVLRHPRRIKLGNDVVIDDNCLLDAKGDDNEGITIGSRVYLGRNSILSCKNGDIRVEDGTNIGFNCEIFSGSRVEVGANTLMAAYCYLIGGDHDYSDSSRPVSAQGRTSAGVTIGPGCWLGAGVMVLDGVTIGAHAIVGAGAVVKADVPAYGVAVSRPARVVGSRLHHAADEQAGGQ
ncbi:MAG: acyltransferase [Acidobacteria bacterium]|nr:acyltransferase [Acidobacteriota bacterium]